MDVVTYKTIYGNYIVEFYQPCLKNITFPFIIDNSTVNLINSNFSSISENDYVLTSDVRFYLLINNICYRGYKRITLTKLLTIVRDGFMILQDSSDILNNNSVIIEERRLDINLIDFLERLVDVKPDTYLGLGVQTILFRNYLIDKGILKERKINLNKLWIF